MAAFNSTPYDDEQSAAHNNMHAVDVAPQQEDEALRSRFGAAASILDSLDTRPLHLRERRPWWKFW